MSFVLCLIIKQQRLGRVIDISNFNFIKWIVSQPKDILVGIVIFALSYLVFLNQHNNPISTGEHFLWFLLFLSSSLLIGFLVSFLCKQSYSTIKSNWVANNKDGIAILEAISEIETNLYQKPSRFGYPKPFSVNIVSEKSGVCLGTVIHYRDDLSKIGFIKVASNGKIISLLLPGRKFIRKKSTNNAY